MAWRSEFRLAGYFSRKLVLNCSCIILTVGKIWESSEHYRVTQHVGSNLPLTSTQKFHFGLARSGQARPKQNFCFDVNGRFEPKYCFTLYFLLLLHTSKTQASLLPEEKTASGPSSAYYQLSIFELFLSVGCLKPKLKWCLNLKLKPKLEWLIKLKPKPNFALLNWVPGRSRRRVTAPETVVLLVLGDAVEQPLLRLFKEPGVLKTRLNCNTVCDLVTFGQTWFHVVRPGRIWSILWKYGHLCWKIGSVPNQ